MARDILDKFKIHIDDAANGIWLPNKPGVGSAAYHRVIHTSWYYKKVENMLRKAKTRDQAIRTLEKISSKLSKNAFFR
jgi:hypothetical protein